MTSVVEIYFVCRLCKTSITITVWSWKYNRRCVLHIGRRELHPWSFGQPKARSKHVWLSWIEQNYTLIISHGATVKTQAGALHAEVHGNAFMRAARQVCIIAEEWEHMGSTSYRKQIKCFGVVKCCKYRLQVSDLHKHCISRNGVSLKFTQDFDVKSLGNQSVKT